MLRVLGALAVVAMIGSGIVCAAEVKGTVKSVDIDKKQVILTIDGGDKTFGVSDNVKVVSVNAKGGRKPTFEALAGGISSITAGAQVTCYTQGDSADKLSEIRVPATAKKRKKAK